MAAPAVRTPRKSAPERREEVVRVAVEHFALTGYNGTSTEAIARDAGISQPYLFRLFKTKRDLFLACEDKVHDRIVATFRAAAEGVPQAERKEAMGRAYMRLLEDRTLLLFQMHAYAASSDDVIRAHVRARYGALVDEVGRLAGLGSGELLAFFGAGMLINVIVSLDMAQEPWAAEWCRPGGLLASGAGT